MSTTDPAVSIVIPLYNEEGNVGPLQKELHNVLEGLDYEVLFVDDGSVDETAARIEEHPRVRLIRFTRNAGQSAALYTGLHEARGGIIAMLDGDLQNNPSDILRLLAAVGEEADLVCSYRENRQDTWVKKISSRIANFVRSRFTGDGVRDTGCTLKAMRRECISALIPFYGMHRFIPALVKGAGYRVVEIPVQHRPRISGVSKYGLGNRALKATIDMFGVRWLVSRQVRLDYKERQPTLKP